MGHGFVKKGLNIRDLTTLTNLTTRTLSNLFNIAIIHLIIITSKMCSRLGSHQRKKAQRWNSKGMTVFVDILFSFLLDRLV